MQCVCRAGQTHGLTLNWKKLEILPVKISCEILRPEGLPIKQNMSMTYLGCTLSSDGTAKTELHRSLGAAKAEFEKLKQIWNHFQISIARKILIFRSLYYQ